MSPLDAVAAAVTSFPASIVEFEPYPLPLGYSLEMMTSISCGGCGKSFPSKNQLFRHLHQSAETCLSPDEFKDFLANTQSTKREKIGVLYGYLPGTDYRFLDQRTTAKANDAPLIGIEGGNHAAWLVTVAIDFVSRGDIDGTANLSGKYPQWSAAADVSKINRSYGSISRVSEAVIQDPHTGAITEVLCTTAIPFYVDDEPSSGHDQITKKTRDWVASVNEQLDRILADMAGARHHPSSLPSNDLHEWSPGMIRVFGRVSIPQKKFNAETDVTHRRVDYCLPADFLYSPTKEGLSKTSVQPDAVSFQDFCDSIPSFYPDNTTYSADSLHDHSCPGGSVKAYLNRMKKIMKRITTPPDDNDDTAQLGEVYAVEKRKAKQKKGHENSSSNAANRNEESHDSKPQPSSKRVLKRRRYHNFCPSILAHDFLSFRRVDRMYHRATIRVDENSSGTDMDQASSI